MCQIYDFDLYKRKFDPNIIYLGDAVLWQDYSGEKYEDIIEGIFLAQTSQKQVNSMKLLEKDQYCIVLKNGMTVIAESIVEKIILKKPRKLKTFQENHGDLNYVHI